MRARYGNLEFEEGFGSWEEAAAASSGYDAPLILEKARDALLKVKTGKAAGERDGVVFDRPQRAHAVIAALLSAAVLNRNRLTVLDIGGSLGTSYFQTRPYLDRLDALAWCIVEQAHFVECGRREFEDEQLRFYYDIDECLLRHAPDIVLLSGVLQCLPSPFKLLHELASRRLPRLVVDRTPLIESDTSEITVLHVPKEIYACSYPIWILSRKELLAPLGDEYEVLDEFQASSGGAFRVSGGVAEFKGLHLVHRRDSR